MELKSHILFVFITILKFGTTVGERQDGAKNVLSTRHDHFDRPLQVKLKNRHERSTSSPVTFMVKDGSVTRAQNLINLTIPEKRRGSEDKGLTVLFGAYDEDRGDTVTPWATSNMAQHGDVFLDLQSNTAPTCTDDKSITNPEVYIRRHLVPCDVLPSGKSAERLSWYTGLLSYAPTEGFHGNDSFDILIKDNFGGNEELITFVLHVVAYPCENGAICKGIDNNDIACTSLLRTKGFFDQGYECECPPGFRGKTCEEDIDDCYSSPCSAPYQCYDMIDGYSCVCPSNHNNCGTVLKKWETAALVAGIGLLASLSAILVVVILSMCRRRRRRNSVKDIESVIPLKNLSKTVDNRPRHSYARQKAENGAKCHKGDKAKQIAPRRSHNKDKSASISDQMRDMKEKHPLEASDDDDTRSEASYGESSRSVTGSWSPPLAVINSNVGLHRNQKRKRDVGHEEDEEDKRRRARNDRDVKVSMDSTVMYRKGWAMFTNKININA